MKVNKLLLKLFLACSLVCALFIIPCVSAQDVVAVQSSTQAATYTLPPDAQNFLLNLLMGLATTHPWVATIIGLMGTMRMWAKPVVSAVHAIIDLTPSKADDTLWASVYAFFTENPVGKFLAYLLDWLASIKIAPPAKPAAPTP